MNGPYPKALTICGYRGQGEDAWRPVGGFDPNEALIDEARGIARTKFTPGKVEKLEVKAR